MILNVSILSSVEITVELERWVKLEMYENLDGSCRKYMNYTVSLV